MIRFLAYIFLFLPFVLFGQAQHYTFGDSLEVDYLRIHDKASEPIKYAWFIGTEVEAPFANGGPTSLILLPGLSGFYQISNHLRLEAGLNYGIRASLEMLDWLDVPNYRANIGLAFTVFESLKSRHLAVLQSTIVTGVKRDNETGRFRTYIDLLIEDTAQISRSVEAIVGINKMATSVGLEYEPSDLISSNGSLDGLSSVQLRAAQATFIELGVAYRARMKFLYSLNEFKTFKAYDLRIPIKVLLPVVQRFDARLDQSNFLIVNSEFQKGVDYFDQYRRNIGFSFGIDLIFPRWTVDAVKVRRLKFEYLNFPLVDQFAHAFKFSFSFGRGKL